MNVKNPMSDILTDSGIRPLVSIIIPTYNCENYIAETINSVLSQSFNDLELIVIDDGSTDKTRKLVESFGPPVRLISQVNAGVCAARNRGIKEARGSFICLMDHDDYWFPDKLLSQVETMRMQPEYGVAYASFILWSPDKTGNYVAPEQIFQNSYPSGTDVDLSGWIYHKLLLDCVMLTSTAMFRREVFDRCGAFNENLPYSEDWDLWLRISREYQFIKLNRPNTLYRQHVKQGNRIARTIDYRTVLLAKAADNWGYCSKDGRCVSRSQFLRKLSEYHAAYGLHQLEAGNRLVGIRSLTKSWVKTPSNIKILICIFAAMFGWKPSY